MSDMHFEKKTRKKGFFEKQGFYIALAVCLLAVGASGWAAVNKLQQNDLTAEGTPSATLSMPAQSSTEDVNKVVSGIPHEISSAPEKAAEPESSAPESKQDNTVSKAPFFVMPAGGSIMKNFDAKNLQYSETYKDWRLHLGVDIAAEAGTPVMAAADGKVTGIAEDALYGTIVTIDHGDGIVGLYCGLNKQPSVKKGDTVEAGKQIGAIDTIPCESVEQSHLHFAMKKNDEYIAPLELMGMLDQE